MTPPSSNNERKSKAPYLFIVCGALVLAIAAGLLLNTPSPATATPSFLGVAEAQYPFIVGSRIDTCDLCHVPNGIPSLNSYGTAFLNNGLNADALVAIENLDSDGDGFTNIQELRAFTFPGNPNDHPVANTATPTATAVPTSVPTTVPSNTPTTVPTIAPTTVPTNTSTSVPTIVPTIVPSNTPGATLTPVPSGTVGPTQTPLPTITPLPTGTVVAPIPPAQCQGDDERNEHFKKSHGKSEEQMSAAEEANEERICEEHEQGNEAEESHESERAQLHEKENGENEINEANETDQAEMGEQENQAQQEDNSQQDNGSQQENQGQQGSLHNERLFFNTTDLWLSQWLVANSGFHD